MFVFGVFVLFFRWVVWIWVVFIRGGGKVGVLIGLRCDVMRCYDICYWVLILGREGSGSWFRVCVFGRGGFLVFGSTFFVDWFF